MALDLSRESERSILFLCLGGEMDDRLMYVSTSGYRRGGLGSRTRCAGERGPREGKDKMVKNGKERKRRATRRIESRK